MIQRSTVPIASGTRLLASRALRQPEVRLEALVEGGHLPLEIHEPSREVDLASLETAFKYEGYLKRQEQSIERQRRQENREIPGNFAFDGIPGLSREMVERLTTVRPATLGQASRIPGVTPAAVAVLAAYLDRPRRPAAV